MAFAHFYHGKTRTFQQSLDEEAIRNLSFTVGLNGSVKGFMEVEDTLANRSLLSSLKENSHGVKVGVGKSYGGFVESAVRERGLWIVNFIGAWEYFEKVDAIAAHKAAVASGAAHGDDASWVKLFYGDSALGVLHEVLVNQRASMVARGFDPELLDFSQLRSHVVSTLDPTWARSYRLNSLEVPTLQSVISDVVGDDGMQLFRIRVSNTVSEPFKFFLEVVPSASVYDLDEAVDDIAQISRDVGEASRRSFSIAKGTDLQDASVVERVNFDSDVAYSALMASAPQERSGAIQRFATVNAQAHGAREGSFEFTTFSDAYDPLDFVTLDVSADGWNSQGIITEKRLEGSKFTYVVQEGDAPAFNGAVVKQPDLGRRIVFNPLHSAATIAGIAANRRENSTGWRT